MDIHIQIRFASDGFPNEDWLDARYSLEDRIIEENIGDIIDAGSGESVMDVVVRVTNAPKAKADIEAILAELELSEISIVRAADQK